MIDFNSNTVFKLAPIGNNDVLAAVKSFLITEEAVLMAFKTVRDQVVFTNKRIIAANVQGLTGKKVDYTSIPYSKIQTFSVETAGVLDMDCELDVWLSGVGKVRFEIRGNFDIVGLNRVISEHIL